ncbi:MAG: TlpA disulfide reductase family protein, partial [Bacteroidales bacterium]|nr:TlpA disulfide reductase family protein [Bacteroidales bacterium]
LLYTSYSYSQAVDSAIKFLENANQIDYQAKIWNLNPGANDTSFLLKQDHVCFTMADSLFNAHFSFDDDHGTSLYNGQEYIMVKKDPGIATVVNLNETPEWRKKIFCAYSYVMILQLLKWAKIEKDVNKIDGLNEIRIVASNKAFRGRMEDAVGENSEITIKFFPGSYYPQNMAIRSHKDGQIVVNSGVFFSDLKISDHCNPGLYSKESISHSVAIADHKMSRNIKVGDTMPNWVVYKPYDKTKILLRELNKEKILLIEFWSTSCRYCIKSVPTLNDLYNRFKENGLEIVYANGLNRDSDDDIEAFIKEYGIRYNVYRFGNICDGFSFPTFLLVDKKGIILYKSVGYPADLKGDVETIMKKCND